MLTQHVEAEEGPSGLLKVWGGHHHTTQSSPGNSLNAKFRVKPLQPLRT